MTDEQARQLKAVYDALIVPGTTSPEVTVNLLFSRVRDIDNAVKELLARLPGPTQ